MKMVSEGEITLLKLEEWPNTTKCCVYITLFKITPIK